MGAYKDVYLSFQHYSSADSMTNIKTVWTLHKKDITVNWNMPFDNRAALCLLSVLKNNN